MAAADYTDFDIDKATEQAWIAFGERLSEVISSMDDSADLRIDAHEDANNAGFVRFHSPGDSTVVAQAASNPDLGEEYLLDADELARMESAGWVAPSIKSGTCFTSSATQDDVSALVTRTIVALRDIYGVPHPVFLAPDQLAEILTDRHDHQAILSDFDPEDVIATIPTSQAHLDAMVAAELEQILESPVMRDNDGDFAFRVGTTMVFVRTTPDMREALIFSVIVYEVEGRSRAVEILNDLNAEARFVSFDLVRDMVFVQMSVLTHPFVPAHLQQAVKAVSEVADGIDEELARKLHGRTAFGTI